MICELDEPEAAQVVIKNEKNEMVVNMTTSNSEKSRVLGFQKVANFRDVGGYPAADGRTVRWGALYRSGHLAKMSRRDLEKFSDLEIDTVIDLRSEYERQRDPNRLPEKNTPNVLELSILDEANSLMHKEIRQTIETKNYGELDSRVLMSAAYRQFAVDFLPEFRQVVHTVLDAEGRPVLWHCTAGKDRTGYAGAVLLRLLGAPWEVIVQDYLLSNQYADQLRGQFFLLRLLKGRQAVNLIRPLLFVQEDWLAGAFEAVEDEWGTFENYAAEGLELSADDIVQLRDQLLV